uniref:Uncharacterized protein n=1 Tax=Anguilla anguilla TaxID=7936 RepID=A0A0E9PHB2_ANGAN
MQLQAGLLLLNCVSFLDVRTVDSDQVPPAWPGN